MTPDSPVDLPEILTRPLEGNAELRVIVKTDLEARMEHFQARKGECTAEQAMARLPGAMAKLQRRWRRTAVMAVVLLLGWLWAVATELPEAVMEAANGQASLTWRPRILQRVASMRMAAIRGPGRDFQEPWQREEDLWKSSAWRLDRDRPAVYLGWIVEQPYRMSWALPADYDAVWRRIDPDNAIWQLLKTGSLAAKAYGGVGSTHLKVVDPAAFDGLVACVEEASRLPRFEDYVGERAAMVRDSFLPPQCFGEASVVASYVNTFSWGGRGRLSDYVLDRMIGELTARGDSEGVRRMVAAGQRCQLLELLSGARPHNYDRTAKYQKGVLRSLREAGVVPVAAEVKERIERLKSIALELAERDSSGAKDQEVRGLYAAMRTSPMSVAWVMVAVREALLMMAGLVLAVAALLGLRMSPRKSAGAETARCLEPLLLGGRPLGLLLLILPGLWLARVWALEEFTDPSGILLRNLGAGGYDFALMLAVLVTCGLGDLDRRLGFLGYRSRRWSRLAGYTVLGVLLLIPVLVVYAGGDNDTQGLNLKMIGCGVAVLALLWMGARAVRGLMTIDGNVRHRLLARSLIPVCLVWVGALLVAVAVLNGLERHLVTGEAVRAMFDPEEPKLDAELEPALRKLLEEWK